MPWRRSDDTSTVEYDFSRRDYPRRTVALLFGLSGNRCANPDCSKKIIADPSHFDDAQVIGHIAHIYAASSKG